MADDLVIGSRTSAQVRLAETLFAGISGRPGGLRETSLLLVASTRVGAGFGPWQAWPPTEVDKALHRLVRFELVECVEEPEGPRWVATGKAIA